ncbi:hypothetical protein NIES4071_72220 [Calothrix sp. NIES-4071]|nr:hypothetical protein NIES4071_72220 [Calothrix sp. NIES-4071]BAZ61497.1 hypothetical protein NIES4105_72170 [Calothrix sp. NIES-4105]
MPYLKNERKQVDASSHAVVIGSSMTGLLAARVLVEHFDLVTVVERDQLPQKPEYRQGVPQTHHVHVLLTQGQRILEQLFPGIKDQLATAGAPSVDWVNDCPTLNMCGWISPTSSEAVTYTCSRVFLEWLVRQRLSSYQNLEFVTSTLFKGLLVNSNNQVSGVKLHCKNSVDKELTADLVVDASGRNSQLPKFLEEIGYQAPETTVINSFLGYSTCWYEVPDRFSAPWKALLLTAKPPNNLRGGVLFPVEGNRWAITLSGIAKDYPPTDSDGFLEFARSLRSPIIYDAIKNAKSISPVYSYRRTENCWRHYEKSHMPDGIVAIGDAVCAFNPVYGQGMTAGALGALTLSHCLKEQFKNSPRNVKGLTAKFQLSLAKILQTPWLMATGEDFRYPTTEGGKADKMSKLMHVYMDKIIALSVSDSDIYKRFIEVAHMIQSPNTLFALPVLYKVLRSSLKQSTLGAPK